MIRPAVLSDIPAIMPMIAAYRDAVRPDLQMQPRTQQKVLQSLIDHPRGCALVADEDGIIGALLGQAVPAMWWPELIADMTFWWVNPPSRGGRASAHLLIAFERWAVAVGARKIGASYTGKSAATFLGRHGYRFAETRMIKDLN